MEILNDYFSQQAATIIGKLKTAGFSEEQADTFITAVKSTVTQSIQGPGAASMVASVMRNGPSRLLTSSNVEVVAKATNMNTGMVAAGFEVMAPFLVQMFSQNRSMLETTVTSSLVESGNGALKSITKLFG